MLLIELHSPSSSKFVVEEIGPKNFSYRARLFAPAFLILALPYLPWFPLQRTPTLDQATVLRIPGTF
jgi:hypothetical protein